MSGGLRWVFFVWLVYQTWLLVLIGYHIVSVGRRRRNEASAFGTLIVLELRFLSQGVAFFALENGDCTSCACFISIWDLLNPGAVAFWTLENWLFLSLEEIVGRAYHLFRRRFILATIELLLYLYAANAHVFIVKLSLSTNFTLVYLA